MDSKTSRKIIPKEYNDNNDDDDDDEPFREKEKRRCGVDCFIMGFHPEFFHRVSSASRVCIPENSRKFSRTIELHVGHSPENLLARNLSVMQNSRQSRPVH